MSELSSQAQAVLDAALELKERARAALADEPADGEPASVTEQPSDGEVVELVAWLEEEADIYAYIGNTDAASKCNRAAELLQHLSPPQPVPVSERLPGQEVEG